MGPVSRMRKVFWYDEIVLLSLNHECGAIRGWRRCATFCRFSLAVTLGAPKCAVYRTPRACVVWTKITHIVTKLIRTWNLTTKTGTVSRSIADQSLQVTMGCRLGGKDFVPCRETHVYLQQFSSVQDRDARNQ